MVDKRSDSFLRLIRHAQRGRLKIYLGYSPGVGKTYKMLEETHQLKTEGVDIVVGLAETHGRVETERLLEGLEIIPRRRQEYHGIIVEEMDIEAILARKPEVAVVDELAHTNVPGSLNDKRYQDVEDLLAAGIHVITTLNVQHLESLYDTVEDAVGVKVRERLPDSVLAEADQIVNVDLATEDLRKRLEEGKVYTLEKIEVALNRFFRASNLEKLRELTLRELASQIDQRRRDIPLDESGSTPDQVMVCLSSRGPNSDRLLRFTSRLAGKLNRNWYAVYVQTPSEYPAAIDVHVQTVLSNTLTLAKQLGAVVFTYKGEDVAETLLQFARDYRVGHMVIGRSNRLSLWRKLLRKKSIVSCLMERGRGISITVLDTRDEMPAAASQPAAAPDEESFVQQPSESDGIPLLSRLLVSSRIVVWDKPATQEEVLQTLVGVARPDMGIGDSASLFEAVMMRERQGSTFFNQGAAFPHVRIEGIEVSLIALGLTKQGVKDVTTDNPIEVVFLIFSPAQNPDAQIRSLAAASRAAQNRRLIQALRRAQTPDEAMAEILRWESAGSGPSNSSS